MASIEDLRDAVLDLSHSLSALDKEGQQEIDLAHALDGSVILGSGDKSNHYITRYRIDRRLQRSAVRDEVQMKECMPCLQPVAKPRSLRKWIWDVLRAEAFLLSLHALIIGLGAAKAAMNLNTVAKDLELIHSALETIVSVFIVVIRMVSSHHAHHELKEYRSKMEVIKKKETSVDNLGTQVKVFLIMSSILLLLDIAAFFVLVWVPGASLSWTIITNNTMLIIIGGFGGQLIGMMSKELSTLREDEHKAVIYESMLVLTECIKAKEPYDKKVVYARANNFCHALLDTDLLSQPDYVMCEDARGEQLDLLTSLSVISS